MQRNWTQGKDMTVIDLGEGKPGTICPVYV